MPLATLDQVKLKLEIPLTNVSEDTAIQQVLDAAEQYILERTGYTLVGTGFTEYIRKPQTRRALYLQRRPIATVAASVRALGSGTWTPVAIDLVDPGTGMIALPWLDPTRKAPPPWFAWREPSWDLLKVDYTTSAFTPPADLSDACATLAAYWYRQDLAGPVVRSSLGSVQESYAQGPIPAQVTEVLSLYDRGRLLWW